VCRYLCVVTRKVRTVYFVCCSCLIRTELTPFFKCGKTGGIRSWSLVHPDNVAAISLPNACIRNEKSRSSNIVYTCMCTHACTEDMMENRKRFPIVCLEPCSVHLI